MSNRSMAVSANFRRDWAVPHAKRAIGAGKIAGEFVLISALAGAAAFVAFVATANWMPAALSHLSAAL